MIITMKDYKLIRHMYSVDGISQRQIAKTLGISRNTVARYCDGAIYPGVRADYRRANSVFTPEVIRFIERCLEEDSQEPNSKQHHTAKRIYDRLVAELGFTGAESSVRAYVRKLRGSCNKVFVPLKFEPGDAMQIDWGECYVHLAGERQKVNYFCARLCHSSAPFVVCFRRQNTEAFLEAVQRALEFFGGTPRRVIFDNARVAVKFGSGKNAVCQESYANMAAHYCFEPEFCNVRKGNEKGLVENLVGWTRRNIFVPVPHVTSLTELNEMVQCRVNDYIGSQQIKGKPAPVSTMLLEDKKALLPLPQRPFDVSQATEARVNSYATVRFSGNDYSVPVKYAGETVGLRAYAENVYIYHGGEKIAEHQRNYGHGRKILKLEHYLPLLKRKPRSILQAMPVTQNLSEAMLHLLRTTDFNEKELVSILELCVEQGENAFWQRLPEFLINKTEPPKIADTVAVQSVDLNAYDNLITEGAIANCKMQA